MSPEHAEAIALLDRLQELTSRMICRSPTGSYTVAQVLHQLIEGGKSIVAHHDAYQSSTLVEPATEVPA